MLYNRDLSWLGFNHRVLQEAKDTSIPLYERLKFLAIFSSNLDEFFRVRYPVIIAFSKLSKKTIRKETLLSEEDIAENMQQTIQQQLDEFGDILNNELIPGLKENKIVFYYNKPFLEQHYAEIKEIFLSKVLSFIQPVILGTDTQYHFIPENNQLYFVVTIKDNLRETISHVVVNIPSKKLKRFYSLSAIDGEKQIVFIDDIIRENLNLLFPGQNIQSVFSIKFNRDADVALGDDYSNQLLDKMEKQLSKRDSGAASRFLFEKGMPANLQMFLAGLFKVNTSDMFEGGRYHNLSDLFSFPSFDDNLHYKKELPIPFPQGNDLFNSILQRDILLHLPYHSYTSVLTFFNQAAVDPDVTDIYISLYRVATESHIVNALISAAKNGKKVTAIIELKARFDEANNIKWSRVMKDAGVKLIYSESHVKVHSKIALIKKKSGGINSSFAVLSTGNFNESTASFYTDHLVMTANKKICSELEWLFTFLQKKGDPLKEDAKHFEELFVTPFNLLNRFEKLINGEIKKARRGEPALIRIKVNNLEEPYFINLLYKASQEGVEIHLIVRSICCLIPGVENMSTNITVRRIVDKYLEHTRLFIFGTDQDCTVAMGSSDLMTRNLRHRVEVCLNVKEDHISRQLIRYFEIQWSDNTKATMLLSNMQQVKVTTEGERINAQQAIYDYVKNISV
jgi:polyphosphate kinase